MLARRTLILGLGLGLGACNFRPLLLEDDEGIGASAELEAIQIEGLEGRLGQLLRNALLDELNPAGVSVPARYVLDVKLSSRASALGIQLNSTITRFNLTLTANFQLRAKGQAELLYRSTVKRVSSYNVSRLPYADLIASQTAERRAAKLVSTDIRTQLAVLFARQAPVT
jgi:hypothetical protein